MIIITQLFNILRSKTIVDYYYIIGIYFLERKMFFEMNKNNYETIIYNYTKSRGKDKWLNTTIMNKQVYFKCRFTYVCSSYPSILPNSYMVINVNYVN